jgi:SNF2 family DNA or RNA helicase
MLFDPPFDSWDCGLKAGRYMEPVTITKEGERLFIHSGYNKILIEAIKSFAGSKWHGNDDEPRKAWSVTDSVRNRFQLRFLAYPGAGHPGNPYNPYDRKLVQFTPNRSNLYAHQIEIAQHCLTRRQCVIAAEMGTGKTLAAIEVIENSGMDDWLWVGPKAANYSVQLEFKRWRAKKLPKFYTYEQLKKLLADWPDNRRAPQGLFVDEASRCKNPTAQRTQCVRHVADSVRREWGDSGFVVLMSGTPAPKSPVDWWSLAEIACPGFLREGTVEKFKQRLAIIAMQEQYVGGGAYPKLVAWRDDEKKCNICGLYEDAECHASAEEVNVFGAEAACHLYTPSVNEVQHLYERLKGLVYVKFKRDCLDLPDKQYREIICKPTTSILNAARAIQVSAPNTITGLILLRELSDGFQYIQTVIGTAVCETCSGTRTIEHPVDENSPDEDFPTPEEIEAGRRRNEEEQSAYENGFDVESTFSGKEIKIGRAVGACPACNGTGFRDKTARSVKQIPCPKEEALKNLLDEHDDVGRIVIYGGFTGTIDRICSAVKSAGWNFIRVDGRGWVSDIPGDPQKMLLNFQEEKIKYPRLAFIGHPGSAGMGLTLTASPTVLYYSNDFNAESRIQSEDRIHRPGMDANRGATIIDLIHLPTDKLVLDNLKKKRRLQDITMGELKSQSEKAEAEVLRIY